MQEEFKKFGISKGEEPVGVGAERLVFQHPYDTKKVVALEKLNKRDSIEARGEYYLTKIMHILFPENIPNIYSYYSKPSASIRQKVELGASHDVLRRSAKSMDAASSAEMFHAFDELNADPRVRNLKKEFDELNIRYDDNVVNFGINEKGQAQYIEPFHFNAIFYDQSSYNRKFGYDRERLRQAIEKLNNTHKQQQAMKFLWRLDVLAAEIKERADKSR